jgi:hypothetical protein
VSSTFEMANEEAVPYTGPKPYGMSDDLITLGALDLDCDERLWVPNPRTSSSARCCSRQVRAASSTSCGCGVRDPVAAPPHAAQSRIHPPRALALPGIRLVGGRRFLRVRAAGRHPHP